MIQLNLLPDVKMEYIKAQRARRLVFTICVVASVVSLVILLILLSAYGLQKKHSKDLNNDITSETHQLQNEPQINKMLTVQNQLESLTTLHNSKPAAVRVFTYLNQVTPTSVSVTDYTIDFTKGTVVITGTSNSLANVNTFIDTLKRSTFIVGGTNSGNNPAFSNVVLSSFGLNTDSQGSNQPANYTINLNYDPVLFNTTKNAQLVVPSKATNRTNTGQAPALFQGPPKATGGSQ